MEIHAAGRHGAVYVQVVWRIVSITATLLTLAACSNSSQNTPVPATATPVSTAAGSVLQVSAQGLDTMVKLTWSPAPTATGYFIYRDGNQVPLNPKPIPQSAYDDIGLTNGRTYSYVVAAVDEAGKIIQRSEAVPIIPKAG